MTGKLQLHQKIKCGAGQSGFQASLQPWHSFLIRFAECASCPEGCLVQPSNLGLGHVTELLIPAPLRCGEGKGQPEQFGQTGCAHAKIIHYPRPTSKYGLVFISHQVT